MEKVGSDLWVRWEVMQVPWIARPSASTHTEQSKHIYEHGPCMYGCMYDECMRVRLYAHMHVCVCMCAFVCTHVHMCVRACVYMYVYACMHASVCERICMYSLYMYVHTLVIYTCMRL